MRLTQTTKDSIINAILADTPREYSNNDMERDAIALCVSRMPEAVRALWDTNNTRPWVAVAYSGELSIHVPSGGVNHPEFKAMGARHRVSNDARSVLKSHVRQLVNQFSTDVQLRAAAPELDKYIPKQYAVIKDAPAVTGVIAELSKAGWPIGEAAK